MQEIMGIIMSWAVTLTNYPHPASMPEVKLVPHSYLVQHACRGFPCHVQGWYPPGDTIYLDDTLDPRNNLYASSVLLHEFVHYLQKVSGRSAMHADCKADVQAEREAYGAQREYLLRYGVYRPVGSSMHNVSC